MGEERARGGSTKRIGSRRILRQCLIFCNENKEQGGSQKQNKKSAGTGDARHRR